MNDRVPCRAANDLRAHMTDLANAEQSTFDPWDDALMHDLFGKRLAEPMADLLQAIDQFDMTKDSFGADAERAIAFLVPKIRKLREAAIDKMRDDL